MADFLKNVFGGGEAQKPVAIKPDSGNFSHDNLSQPGSKLTTDVQH